MNKVSIIRRSIILGAPMMSVLSGCKAAEASPLQKSYKKWTSNKRNEIGVLYSDTIPLTEPLHIETKSTLVSLDMVDAWEQEAPENALKISRLRGAVKAGLAVVSFSIDLRQFATSGAGLGFTVMNPIGKADSNDYIVFDDIENQIQFFANDNSGRKSRIINYTGNLSGKMYFGQQYHSCFIFENSQDDIGFGALVFNFKIKNIMTAIEPTNDFHTYSMQNFWYPNGAAKEDRVREAEYEIDWDTVERVVQIAALAVDMKDVIQFIGRNLT